MTDPSGGAAAILAQGIYEGGLPIEEIFGLPVHPLVVHAAVVLIPLASLGLVLMAMAVAAAEVAVGLSILIALFRHIRSVSVDAPRATALRD